MLASLSEDSPSLSAYRSLSGLVLLGVWLIAAQDVLLGGKLSSALDAYPSLHPASFVAFTAVVLLALGRRGLLGVLVAARGVALSSRLVTVVLGLFVLGRGLEIVMGLPLISLDAVLGEMTSRSYSSFTTLLLLWLLHGVDAHWSKRERGPLAWANYAIFSITLSHTLHVISDAFGFRDHSEFLMAMSVLCASLFLSLAAFIFVDSPAAALLFDRRAPKSNAASAVSLVVVFAVIFLLEFLFPYQHLALSSCALLLFGLPFMIATFRPLEIDARIKSGELVEEEDEDDLSAYAVLHAQPAEAPSDAKPEGLLARTIHWATFEAANWQRLAIQGFWTFALAYGAIMLSRQPGGAIASIWWANGYLAYCLLLQPKRQWFKPLLTFFGAVLLANILADNVFETSTYFSLVNMIEGSLLALLVTQIFDIRLVEKQVHIGRKDSRTLIIFLFFAPLVLLATSIIGGGVVVKVFGGSQIDHAKTWFFGSIVGFMPMFALGLGKLQTIHLGAKRLTPTLPSFSILFPIHVVATLIFCVLMAPAYVTKPHLAYLFLSIPLFFTPSLLHTAVALIITSTAYFYFGSNLWQSAGIASQFPVMTTSTIAIFCGVFIARYHFANLIHSIATATALAPNALVTLNGLGRVLSISKNAKEWFESSRTELIGKRLKTLFDNSGELETILGDGFVNGTASTFNFIARRTKADGSVLYFEVSTQTNTDPSLPYAFVVSLRDITREVELEEAKTALIDRSSSHLLVQDAQWNTLQCSDAWIQFTGYSREETLSKDFHAFLHPDDRKHAKQVRELMGDGEGLGPNDDSTTYRLITKAGDEKLVQLRSIRQIERGRICFLLTLLDVTDLEKQRQALERALQNSEALLAAGTSAYTVVDENFERVLMSEQAMELFGYSDAQDVVPYLKMYKNLTEEKRQAQLQELRELETAKILRFSEIDEMHTPAGRVMRIKRSSRWFPNPLGDGRLLWTNLEDVTELMRTQDQLTRLVERDTLTGLLSRRGLSSRFMDRQRLQDAGLFILDADHFKSVNDSYGHDVGDALLKAYSKTLKSLTEEVGCAIRLGGEEFAVIRPWSGWEEAHTFAETLRKALAETEIEVNGRRIQRTASLGFAELRKGAEVSEAMKLADMMQREAKASGRNKVIGADPKTLALLEARGVFITNEQVQEAMERGELSHYVQPIWNTKKNAIEGFEALIRWQKPNGTLVLPAQFVDVLYRLIMRDPDFRNKKAKLGRDVVAKLGDFPEAYVSFNYKLEQISFTGAAALIDAELSACRDHPNRQLVIEISEASINDRVESDVLVKELEALKGFGYLIALDDFGVESSNIKRLQDLPIDIVKLDKSLVMGLERNAKQRTTIKALSLMLQNLELKIIVEGVETHKQAEFIAGCELFSQQGYLHARPMRPTEVAPNLADIGADIADL